MNLKHPRSELERPLFSRESIPTENSNVTESNVEYIYINCASGSVTLASGALQIGLLLLLINYL